jgi:uncharacterized protein YdeI (YjbR/CyaY-like superfamily)
MKEAKSSKEKYGRLHEMPSDLKKAIDSDAKSKAAWESLTPLAKNEWICWTISVKKDETRKEHVERVRTELKEGMRRPCCWPGCMHRTDKVLSPSQKFVLSRKTKR